MHVKWLPEEGTYAIPCSDRTNLFIEGNVNCAFDDCVALCQYDPLLRITKVWHLSTWSPKTHRYSEESCWRITEEGAEDYSSIVADILGAFLRDHHSLPNREMTEQEEVYERERLVEVAFIKSDGRWGVLAH